MHGEKAETGRRKSAADGKFGHGKKLAHHRPAEVYAAIDLGTNNCRLLVARPATDGFRVIDAFSRIVRLGEGVDRSGRLAETAMARTIAALRVCAVKMRRSGVTRSRSVATGACRMAANGQDFLIRAARDSGIELEIIDGAEEARLAVAGATELFDFEHRYVLIFDIGGASVELIWLKLTADQGAEIIDSTSIGCGVATLAERHNGGAGIPPAFDLMAGEFGPLLGRFEADNRIRSVIERAKVQLLGTSGTTTTLAGIHLGLTRYDRARVDGMRIRRADLIEVVRKVMSMDYNRLSRHGCVGPQRADWVVPGAVILQAMMDYWPCAALTVADRGIRDGILRQLIARDAADRPPA